MATRLPMSVVKGLAKWLGRGQKGTPPSVEGSSADTDGTTEGIKPLPETTPRGVEDGVFISMVTHELRTPLTVVKEGLTLTLEEAIGSLSDEQRQLLTLVNRNVDRIGLLLNDLQDLARVQNGRLAFQKGVVALETVIAQAVQDTRPAWQAQGLSVEVKPFQGIPPLFSDRHRLLQVLINLMGNAIKFTPAGGKIAIEAERDDPTNHVKVSVSDTGCGLPAKALEKIFDPFYQVNRPTPPEVKGSGLGLAICRLIVENHGGRIWAENRPGGGSRFTFTVPLYAVNSALLEVFRDMQERAIEEQNPLILCLFDCVPPTPAFVHPSAEDQIRCQESLMAAIRASLDRLDQTLQLQDPWQFVALCHSEARHAKTIGRRVCQQVRRHSVFLGTTPVRVDVRWAYSVFPHDGPDLETLLAKARTQLESERPTTTTHPGG